ncbi:MAG: spore coat protein [Treponema sp. GWB1_62_6]|nr:MAG: spore coat protein [Treponema sp. GWA1_62_8]OHE64962.1 MAG: spore coat protein [Treponema sp. GWB1_62_6]OHE67025.1 MAG: spore coat protein [Treponema sp. GWC1_61_84]OHE70935.1 MAG: spore coat protein [Treponema sp. RIFOXYC1_FULL_61_9]HCM27349.1 spore coat protein [Treponema sp.]
MTAVVLQARIDSSRLPGKALLELGGEPMIFRVMQALQAVAADVRVLACPEDAREAFRSLADRAGFRLVTGSKDDVLSRYCDAIRATGADRVIRATGDNPFVFADAANEINLQGERLGADYASYAGLPYGTGVEALRSEALLRAEREAGNPHEREHVCPYLYGNPDAFLLHRPVAPSDWRMSGMRVSVDTREDCDRARRLYEELILLQGDPFRTSAPAVIAAWRKLEEREARE